MCRIMCFVSSSLSLSQSEQALLEQISLFLFSLRQPFIFFHLVINIFATLVCINLHDIKRQFHQLSLQYGQTQLNIHRDPTKAFQYMTNIKEDTKHASAILAMSPSSAGLLHEPLYSPSQ